MMNNDLLIKNLTALKLLNHKKGFKVDDKLISPSEHTALIDTLIANTAYLAGLDYLSFLKRPNIPEAEDKTKKLIEDIVKSYREIGD